MVAKNTFNYTQGKKVMSDDYKKQNLMTNLHHRMRDAEYNQTDLARCTGVAQPTISRLLSGRGIPSVFYKKFLQGIVHNEILFLEFLKNKSY